ncbi:hypothetical protein DAT35_28910 [Vitiosangium sp. GDMCC 1.1324]|nr:hypothetical protein DAT35_28910 [Vitiosangium sp. GDMCC 1.1324]
MERVTGISRAEGADVILRVRALERVSGTAPVERRGSSRRSFAEVLERQERGLGRAEPLVEPAHPHPRPASPPEVEDESLRPPAPLPDTFLGLLWWKVKGHQR